MKWRLLGTSATVALILAACCAPSQAAISVEDYAATDLMLNLSNLAAAPGGAIWGIASDEPVTGKARVGRLAADHSIVTTTLPDVDVLSRSDPVSAIAVDASGDAWYSRCFASNSLGRVTAAGAVTAFTEASNDFCPWSMTALPGGGLIATGDRHYGPDPGPRYGSVSASGAVTDLGSLQNGHGEYVAGITTGADGNAWVTLSGHADGQVSELANIDSSSGAVSFISLRSIPAADAAQFPGIEDSHVSSPSASADGIWVASGDSFGNEIDFVSYAGQVKRFAVPFGVTSNPVSFGEDRSWFLGTTCTGPNTYEDTERFLATVDSDGQVSVVNGYSPSSTEGFGLFATSDRGLWRIDSNFYPNATPPTYGPASLRKLDSTVLTDGDLSPAAEPGSSASISDIRDDRVYTVRYVTAGGILGRCYGPMDVTVTHGSTVVQHTEERASQLYPARFYVPVEDDWMNFTVAVRSQGTLLAEKEFNLKSNSIAPSLAFSKVARKLRKGKKLRFEITVREGWGLVSAQLTKGKSKARPKTTVTTRTTAAGAKHTTYYFTFKPRKTGKWLLKANFKGLGAWQSKTIKKRVIVTR